MSAGITITLVITDQQHLMGAGARETNELITCQQAWDQLHYKISFADVGPAANDRQVTLGNAVRDQPFHLGQHYVAAIISAKELEDFTTFVGLNFQE